MSWAILTRKSAGAVDGIEGLAQVVDGSAAVMACRPAWISIVR
jgi:hypothetical protein